MKAKMTLAITLVTLLLSLIIPNSLLAYEPFGYWEDMSIEYDYHTLSSSWRSAVSYGSSRWNGVSGSDFEWDPDLSGGNDVYKNYLDGAGTVLAVTTANLTNDDGEVIQNGIFDWVNIQFDEDEPWYTGSGTPTSSQLDLRSTATHEFGHALGLHHSLSSSCQDSESVRPTMCSGYKKGKTWKRTLQEDDRDGLEFLYPDNSSRQQALKISGDRRMMIHFEYQQINLTEAIKASSQIIMGTIVEISATRWNQDSGEYWEGMSKDGTTRYTALPYYTLTLVNGRDMASGFSYVNNDVSITVLGVSPVDSGETNHAFQVGNELVGMIRPSKLKWRSGKMPIIQFVGDPAYSYLSLAADGKLYQGGSLDSSGKVRSGVTTEEFERLVQKVRAD